MLRFPISLAFALPATALLFLLMHALISVRGEIGEAQSTVKIEFSRLRRESPVEPKKRAKPEREAPAQKPPPPGMATAKSLDPNETMAELVANIDPGIDLGGATVLGGGGGGGGGGGRHAASEERDVLPLVRVDPEYPPRAKQQGIEGWVEVEFTISAAGTVKDAKVLAAEPPSVFEQAAINAIRRWRYNPKLENGVAVARAGVQVRLRFELPRGRR